MDKALAARLIRQFIEETFFFSEAESLADDDSFLERGIIDSTGILELIAFLQDTFEIRVEDEEAIPDNLDSIERVAEFLTRKLDGSAEQLAATAEEKRA